MSTHPYLRRADESKLEEKINSGDVRRRRCERGELSGCNGK